MPYIGGQVRFRERTVHSCAEVGGGLPGEFVAVPACAAHAQVVTPGAWPVLRGRGGGRRLGVDLDAPFVVTLQLVQGGSEVAFVGVQTSQQTVVVEVHRGQPEG